MEGSEEVDAPPQDKRRRTSNACVQCQRNKKRCDGGIPKCTSCTERQLACTYRGVRRRGRGKAKPHIEKLEARVSELETSLRHSTSASVGSADNEVSKVGTDQNSAQSTLSDRLNASESEASAPTCRSDDPEQTQKAQRDRFFTILPEQPTAETLRSEANHGAFTSPIFIQLPPKAHLQSLFEVALVELNHQVPFFDTPLLLTLLDEHFAHPTAPRGENPQRWAMLNTAVAVAIQLRTAKGSERAMMELSWAFFKNAFSVYPAITLRGADILAVDALLAMAVYMQGSTDLRTTSVLVCAAARLSSTLGLHRPTYYSGLDSAAANRSRRAFWASYLLDKDISVRTGLPSNFDQEAISLHHFNIAVPGSEIGSHGLGMDMSASTLIQFQVQLAMIDSTVEKRLFSTSSNEKSAHQLLNIAAELDHQLMTWKASLPVHLRADHLDRSSPTTTIAREPIIQLHLAYYSTLCELHSFSAHLDPHDVPSTIQQANSARTTQISAASETIHLLQCLSRREQPGYLWHILFYPTAACITLVTVVLDRPRDPQARFCAERIGELVAFLRALQRDGNLEVQALLDLCCVLEKLVLNTILNAVNVTTAEGSPCTGIALELDTWRQQILSPTHTHTHNRTSSMHLASGLLGNIPNLCSIAATTFSGLLPKGQIQISPVSSLLAPPSLDPGRYGFGFA
ncbi:hypothetical protein P168DRAFT_107473 [Aspergillus campestris IBT 28561]|uniref:Zn(2)-C6 fungal-type domain-containing protein n=1 Tax=Aspergillus campestris (strain IBT 28561) TaxID=1392248 RepID=A0A2I1D8S8_ASPC2|nr:uncharacterized protein P168DRAFT_107473 [Aspergillus campestris IBT 28561]PKY06267.1 hypothetical protein P168DRAFT_107473 [Aspergillus campestris IBT 28561]